MTKERKDRTGCNQGQPLSGDPAGISHVGVLGKVCPLRVGCIRDSGALRTGKRSRSPRKRNWGAAKKNWAVPSTLVVCVMWAYGVIGGINLVLENGLDFTSPFGVVTDAVIFPLVLIFALHTAVMIWNNRDLLDTWILIPRKPARGWRSRRKNIVRVFSRKVQE